MSNQEENLLDTTLKALFEEAAEDKMITDDEFELIQSIEFSVEEYMEVLEKALEDGVIDEQESEQLSKFKQQIMEKAKETAKLDGVIDKEEKAILSKLSEIVNQYYQH